MRRLRTGLISSLVALCTTGFALAVAQDGGNGQAPAGRAGADRAGAAKAPAGGLREDKMNDLLIRWEQQSARLTSLEVDVYRIDKDPAWWNDEKHFLGHAAFKGPQLTYLDFRKVKLQAQVDPKDKNKKKLAPVLKNGQIQAVPYQTIVCTGAEVWDYRYDVREIFVYTLDKDARKRALEEGPLPFLFNMKAQEAKERYDMVLWSEDDKAYLVKVLPKSREEKERYSTTWIYLDRSYLLPTRIVRIMTDKKSTQDFHLSHIEPNKTPVDPRFFKAVKPEDDWEVIRNPGAANAKLRLLDLLMQPLLQLGAKLAMVL